MVVKRIVANIAAANPADAQRFYGEVLGLDVKMNLGWIVTLGTDVQAPVQISAASEGGSGTAVPDLSIEVEDVDAVHVKAQALGFEILYPLTDEPWGVRRFYVRDPFGKLVNILTHLD